MLVKYVLISGANGGMGRETISYLVNQGYCVLALDNKEMEKQENVYPILADVTNEESINNAFNKVCENNSKIIITTSELAPLDPLPFTGIYAISKSTLDKYAYSLNMELQLLNIKVVVLRAGAIKTNMLNVSTSQLDDFCSNTKLYKCNAKRFKGIVDNVEAKSVLPIKVAQKVNKILSKKKPKFAYKINNNKLLKLLNILPNKMQFFIIKQVLKDN